MFDFKTNCLVFFCHHLTVLIAFLFVFLHSKFEILLTVYSCFVSVFIWSNFIFTVLSAIFFVSFTYLTVLLQLAFFLEFFIKYLNDVSDFLRLMSVFFFNSFKIQIYHLETDYCWLNKKMKLNLTALQIQ